MRIKPRAFATAALALATAALTATVSAGTAQAAAPSACTSSKVKLTVKNVERPLNHLLLKATNTSGKTCFAYNAPYLRFHEEAQAPVQWNEDSVPQAVVTLEPGQSAYAGITTSTPEGSDGHTARDLGVLFANRAANGSVGNLKTAQLPGEGVYVDSSAQVTYWQPNAAAALAW
ncbi:DUF4232 domain-containing protein [Streptomyces aurantiacus]|uniref:DUF4232 domain-containing protein n=1 Tax=Streptomyces aurantiacus JA 4570 TaxID=1286094 RepID=S4A255_9ACTN|nr:DUF4232 domain-containing protein [Streptomyces aurantiacus]EPH44830.1 hypothetical protein STRAU_2120 [Streptomyces aurantiacus JA 4570]